MKRLNNRRVRFICSLFIATLITIIIFVASCLEPSEFSFWIFVIATLLLFLIWEYAEWISKKLDEKTPWNSGFSKRLFLQFFYISAGAVIIFVVPYSIYKWYSISFIETPVKNLTAYLLFLAGMLGSFLLILSLLVFGLQLSLYFMEKWKNSQILTEQLKRETIKAQLDSIRGQIDPHFLFNNFNALYGLIEEDSDLAKEYLLELSNIYRYILQNKDEEVVPLEREIDVAESYIFLIKNRYGGAIQVEWKVETYDELYNLPPLTLQMLLENAIKHNSIEENHPLLIRISIIDDYLEASNSVNPRKTVASTGLGLKNLKQRFHYLTDRPLQIIKSENIFVVKIPLLKVKR